MVLHRVLTPVGPTTGRGAPPEFDCVGGIPATAHSYIAKIWADEALAPSEECFGVEHQIIALILGRQHHGATPPLIHAYRYPDIIQIWRYLPV